MRKVPIKTTPNDHTSDCLEKTFSVSDSGAIHFTGNLPLKNKLPQLNMTIHSAGLLLDTTWDELIGQIINDILKISVSIAGGKCSSLKNAPLLLYKLYLKLCWFIMNVQSSDLTRFNDGLMAHRLVCYFSSSMRISRIAGTTTITFINRPAIQSNVH